MDSEFNYNNYWDYISVCDQREGVETLKDLAKDSFPLFKTYLDELYYIEANFIYMNLVLDIPQQTIAGLFGVSQLGVSKRVRGGVKKIQTTLKKPEQNRNRIRKDLELIVPKCHLEIAVLYYQMKTFSLVSDVTRVSNSGVKNKINNILDSMKILSNGDEETVRRIYRKMHSRNCEDWMLVSDTADRYYKYFNILLSSYNYGDYIFKGGKPQG